MYRNSIFGRNISFKDLIYILMLASLAACGGGGDKDSSNPPSPPVTASTGVFVDSTVAGLHYETPTLSGTTNSAGEYDFLPGETVTFSIGGIVLGSAAAGPVVTPLTLVSGATDPTDPVVTNIVRFLLTLDDDGNPDNGISISPATTTAAVGLSVDFTTPDLTTDAGVTTLLAALQGTPTLVDTTVAQTHFTEILATTWGSMNWGSGTWKAAATP
jgi:hypothetical protein